MKYTKLERNWVMQMRATPALVLLNTSVVPIYFNAINTGASSADLVAARGATRRRLPASHCHAHAHSGALADYAGNKTVLLGFFPHGPGPLPGAGYPNVRQVAF